MTPRANLAWVTVFAAAMLACAPNDGQQPGASAPTGGDQREAVALPDRPSILAVPVSPPSAREPGDARASDTTAKLRAALDGALRTEPGREQARIVEALSAIVDALGETPAVDAGAVARMRRAVLRLRDSKVQSHVHADQALAAMDAAVAALRSAEMVASRRELDAAVKRVNELDRTRPLLKQAEAMYGALCAVGNVIVVEHGAAHLDCVSDLRGAAPSRDGQ